MSQQVGFDLDTPGYDKLKFYTKAQDNRGHRESINLKISPSQAQAIGQIIESGKIPAYKTSGDLIRDAVMHRIHDLVVEYRLLDESVMTLLRFEMVMARTLDEHERYFTYEQNIERLAKLIKKMEEQGQDGLMEARNLVQEIMDNLDAVRDRPFYVNLYRAILEKEKVDLEAYLG